jgi:putative redox protein
MGAMQHMRARFVKDDWKVINDRDQSIAIGPGNEQFAPYDLLLGALESCLYATFTEVAEKMKETYAFVEFDVTGIKRDEDVATLERCTVEVTISGASHQKKLTKAFDVATRYCSVYQTISQVAQMSWEVTFID